MRLTTFNTIPVGTRFREFRVTSLAVYTKLSNEDSIDQASGMRVTNAHSELRGWTGIAPEQPVIAITDEEVIEARQLEKAVLIGERLLEQTEILDGRLYFAVEILRPRREDIKTSLKIWS